MPIMMRRLQSARGLGHRFGHGSAVAVTSMIAMIMFLATMQLVAAIGDDLGSIDYKDVEFWDELRETAIAGTIDQATLEQAGGWPALPNKLSAMTVRPDQSKPTMVLAAVALLEDDEADLTDEADIRETLRRESKPRGPENYFSIPVFVRPTDKVVVWVNNEVDPVVREPGTASKRDEQHGDAGDSASSSSSNAEDNVTTGDECDVNGCGGVPFAQGVHPEARSVKLSEIQLEVGQSLSEDNFLVEGTMRIVAATIIATNLELLPSKGSHELTIMSPFDGDEVEPTQNGAFHILVEIRCRYKHWETPLEFPAMLVLVGDEGRSFITRQTVLPSHNEKQGVSQAVIQLHGWGPIEHNVSIALVDEDFSWGGSPAKFNGTILTQAHVVFSIKIPETILTVPPTADVCVAMLSCRRPHILFVTLNRFRNYTEHVEPDLWYEVALVDNGSGEATQQRIRDDMGDVLASTAFFKNNRGISQGLNTLYFGLCRSSYVLPLEDDWGARNWTADIPVISNAMIVLEHDPQVAEVWLAEWEIENFKNQSDWLWAEGKTGRDGRRTRVQYRRQCHDRANGHPWGTYTHNPSLKRRSTLIDIGMFRGTNFDGELDYARRSLAGQWCSAHLCLNTKEQGPCANGMGDNGSAERGFFNGHYYGLFQHLGEAEVGTSPGHSDHFLSHKRYQDDETWASKNARGRAATSGAGGHGAASEGDGDGDGDGDGGVDLTAPDYETYEPYDGPYDGVDVNGNRDDGTLDADAGGSDGDGDGDGDGDDDGDGGDDDRDGVKVWFAALTTVPSRIETLRETLKTISQQVERLGTSQQTDGIDASPFPPERIFVALPRRSKRFGVDYPAPPQWLKDWPLVTILQCEDYGPATKLIPALDAAYDLRGPNAAVITFDDDIAYGPNTAYNLIWYGAQYPHAILAHAGYNIVRRPITHENFEYHRNAPEVTRVDCVGGYLGALYRPAFFNATHFYQPLSQSHPLSQGNAEETRPPPGTLADAYTQRKPMANSHGAVTPVAAVAGVATTATTLAATVASAVASLAGVKINDTASGTDTATSTGSDSDASSNPASVATGFPKEDAFYVDDDYFSGEAAYRGVPIYVVPRHGQWILGVKGVTDDKSGLNQQPPEGETNPNIKRQSRVLTWYADQGYLPVDKTDDDM